jgi:hypothetical protein
MNVQKHCQEYTGEKDHLGQAGAKEDKIKMNLKEINLDNED